MASQPSSPRQTAAVILLDNRNRVALLRRRGNPGRWELPGGKVMREETPAQAACRCATRELGLHVETAQAPLGQASFLQGDTRWQQLWLAVEYAPGTPAIAQPDQFDMLRWVPLDLLDVLFPVAPGLRLFTREVQSGAFADQLTDAYRWSPAEDPASRCAQWEQLRALAEGRGQA